MPVLPASGYGVPVAPTVDPLPLAPGGTYDIRAGAESFGGAQAEALTRLGGAFEKVSGSFENIHRFYEETAADDQSLKTQIAVNKLMYGDPDVPGDRGFVGLEGEHALREMPVRRKQIEKVIADSRAALRSQYAASRYDNEIQRFRNTTLSEMGRKHDAELSRYREKTDKGRLDLSMGDMSRTANTGEMAAFKEKLAADEALVREQGERNGTPKEAIDAEVMKRRGAAAKEMAESLLAKDALQGRSFIRLNGDILGAHHPELSARADQMVEKQMSDDLIAGKDVSRYSEKLPAPGGQLVRGGATQAAIGAAAVEQYNHLISIGASHNKAVLLTSAAQAESNFNPEAKHDEAALAKRGLPPGYGMYGHNAERLAAMQRRFGPRPTWQQQNQFALDELNSRPEGALVDNAKTPEELLELQHAFEVYQRNPQTDARRLGTTRQLFANPPKGGSGGSTAPAQPSPSAGAEAPKPAIAPITATPPTAVPPIAAPPSTGVVGEITGTDGKTYPVTQAESQQFYSIQKPEAAQKFLEGLPKDRPSTPTTQTAAPAVPSTGNPKVDQLMAALPPPDEGLSPDKDVPGLEKALQEMAKKIPADAPPGVWPTVARKLRVEHNARHTDAQRALQAKDRADRESDEALMNEYRLRIGTDNPPSAQEALADKRWKKSGNAMEMFRFLDAGTKPAKSKNITDDNAADLRRRLLSDTDPDKITDIEVVRKEYYKRNIELSDLEKLEKVHLDKLDAKKSDVNKKTERILKGAVRQQIRPYYEAGDNLMEKMQDEQALAKGQMTAGSREVAWQNKVDQAVEERVAAGKSTADLFDPKPGNSAYIGSPEFLAEFIPPKEITLAPATPGQGPNLTTIEGIRQAYNNLATPLDRAKARDAVAAAFKSGKFGNVNDPAVKERVTRLLEDNGLVRKASPSAVVVPFR